MATPEEIPEAEGSGDGGRTGDPGVDSRRGQEGIHGRSWTNDGTEEERKISRFTFEPLGHGLNRRHSARVRSLPGEL